MGTGVTFRRSAECAGGRDSRAAGRQLRVAGPAALCLVLAGLAGCSDWEQARELVLQEPAAGVAADCVVSSVPADAQGEGPGLARIRLDPCDPALADATEAGTILFASAGIGLDAAARSAISGLAAELQAKPGVSVAIVGHTDSLGAPAQNLSISQRRAEAVRDALVAAGIEAARIRHVEGRGETDLAVPTGDGVATRENRRVQVLML